MIDALRIAYLNIRGLNVARGHFPGCLLFPPCHLMDQCSPYLLLSFAIIIKIIIVIVTMVIIILVVISNESTGKESKI